MKNFKKINILSLSVVYEKIRKGYEKYNKTNIPSLSVIREKVSHHQKTSICIVLIVIVVFILSLQKIPEWQVSRYGINNTTTEADLENQYRATLAQMLGGGAIGIGLYYSWRRVDIAGKDLKATQENLKNTYEVAQANLKVSQESHITELFTRAIDQLGNQSLEIRLVSRKFNYGTYYSVASHQHVDIQFRGDPQLNFHDTRWNICP